MGEKGKQIGIDGKLIPPHCLVLLGLSGGGDSVFLFHELCRVSREQTFAWRAIHINHGLRGEAADGDEAFVRELCLQAGVPLVSERVDVRTIAAERGQTLEQAGREARYEVFYREARRALSEDPQLSQVRIFLAHHGNDQEETVLMNFLRGSGLTGLAGMRRESCVFVHEGRPVYLVRPLLNCSHEELLGELRRRSLSWREDATNQKEDCTRNKLRLSLIPEIRALSPGFFQICQRNSAIYGQVDDYMQGQAEEFLTRHGQREPDGLFVDREALLQLHEALLGYVLRSCIDRVSGLKDVSYEHIRAVTALLDKQSGSRVCLPGGLVARRDFGRICFSMDEPAEAQSGPEWALSWEICPDIAGEIVKNLEKYRKEPYTKWFDYDKITKCCGAREPVLRLPQEGDYLIVNQSGQKKKLQLYLKQEKISAAQRGRTAVAAWGNLILWVIGHRTSESFHVTGETRRVLRLSVEPYGSEE